MKTIRNWDDLKEYGIRALTGEACAINARALVDLTEQGADNIREFLGILPHVPGVAIFQDNWNSGAIHSMFLPWDILPSLAAFLLIKSGCILVYHVESDGLYGIEPGDDSKLVSEYFDGQTVTRQYRPLNGQASVGLSSVHATSGRAQ